MRGDKTSVEIPGAETAAPALVVGDCNIGVTLTAEQFPAVQRSLLRVAIERARTGGLGHWLLAAGLDDESPATERK